MRLRTLALAVAAAAAGWTLRTLAHVTIADAPVYPQIECQSCGLPIHTDTDQPVECPTCGELA